MRWRAVSHRQRVHASARSETGTSHSRVKNGQQVAGVRLRASVVMVSAQTHRGHPSAWRKAPAPSIACVTQCSLYLYPIANVASVSTSTRCTWFLRDPSTADDDGLLRTSMFGDGQGGCAIHQCGGGVADIAPSPGPSTGGLHGPAPDVHTGHRGGAQWRRIDDFAQQALVWVSIENQQAGKPTDSCRFSGNSTATRRLAARRG